MKKGIRKLGLVLALLLLAGLALAQELGGSFDIGQYFVDTALAGAAIAGLVKLLRETVWPTLDGVNVRLVSIGLGGLLAVLAFFLGLTPAGWTLTGALVYGLSAGAAAVLGIGAARAATGYEKQKEAALAAGLAAAVPQSAALDVSLWNTPAGRFIEKYLRSVLPESLIPVVKLIVQGIVLEATDRAWSSELAGELQAKVRSVLTSLGLMKPNTHGPKVAGG